VCAQRDWGLAIDTYVLERMLGPTMGYQHGPVLLQQEDYGELHRATHVSAIVMIDYFRGADLVYASTVLLNPWSDNPADPAWFPHSRVLCCTGGVFSWLRGSPSGTTFPDGTRLATQPRGAGC